MGTQKHQHRFIVTLASLVSVVVMMTTLAMPVAAKSNDAGWRGEYYANPTLSGSPTLVRDDVVLDFNWDHHVSPAAGIPDDYFSVRWTKSVYFEAGNYRFHTLTDDGVRLYVDGRLILDQWHVMGSTEHTGETQLSAGVHQIMMDYFEANGRAVAKLWWSRADAPSAPTITEWRGEYFGNRWLSGSPSLVRNDSDVNFNWGYGSPAAVIPADNFSVRWTRTLDFAAGRYRFTTETDDGVRLYVDGQLVIDRWHDMAPTQFSVDVDLAAGAHTIQVEYYEAGSGAVARLSWVHVATPDQPITEWRGEYFNNQWLSGEPAFVRNDATIDFDWDYGAPDTRVGADYFSVRWTRDFNFEGGRYRFTTETDDGVRFYVDGRLLIDRWHTMSRTRYTQEIHLGEGVHSIRMEYFENWGAASAKLTWEGPIPYPTRGNLVAYALPSPSYSWIKAYQLQPDGSWLDIRPDGWAPIDTNGYLKVDGLPVDHLRYGGAGHPYRIELWVDNVLIRSVGNTTGGESEFRIRPDVDNHTPWGPLY